MGADPQELAFRGGRGSPRCLGQVEWRKVGASLGAEEGLGSVCGVAGTGLG